MIYGNQVFEIGTFKYGNIIYDMLVSGFSALNGLGKVKIRDV